MAYKLPDTQAWNIRIKTITNISQSCCVAVLTSYMLRMSLISQVKKVEISI